jgi:hypothetical protein
MIAFSLSTQTKYWSVLGAFAQGCRRWIGTRAAELLEVARLGAGEVGYLTHDAGLSGSDLHPVAGHHPIDADLLARRMVALALDPYEVALCEPALVRYLQRRCSLCESRGRCLRDLARESTGSVRQDRHEWQEYCPNTSTLEMLSTLQSRTKVAPKYSFPYLG